MRIELTSGNDNFSQKYEDRNNWDEFVGLEGDDVIRAYQGNVRGGPGKDRIERIVDPANPVRGLHWLSDGRGPVTVDLQDGWALDDYGSRDTLIGLNGAHGSGNNDWFRGNELDNFFWGNGGQDTFIGGVGDDGVQLPGFQPSAGARWRDPALSDLNIAVSADGQKARVSPISGLGFDLQLQGIEYLWGRFNGIWSRVNLADYITQATMAQEGLLGLATQRWNAGSPLGTSASLTFSFVTTAPGSGPGATGFRAFTDGERFFTRLMLAQLTDLTGLRFTEVSESATTVGDLRFGVSQQAATKGVSWMPGVGGSLAGDVWMDVESMIGLRPGTEGYQALMHEIGHALGLRHPRNVDPGEAWSTQLRASDDRTVLTVMSQNASPDGLFRAEWGPLDVLALRALYGTRAVYTAASTYRLQASDGQRQFTIVDDGGIDTLDASALPTPVSINLRPGSLSSIGSGPDGRSALDNLAIVEGTIIENLIGTNLDDALTGNEADNRIDGRAGNDVIDGGGGIDTVVLSGPMSAYRLYNSYGVLYIEAVDGVSGYDSLVNVERLAFADRTVDADNARLTGDIRQGERITAVIQMAQPQRVVGQMSYQWRLNDTPITGATTASYVPTQSDVNGSLSVAVTYVDERGQTGSFLARAPGAVENANDPPVGFVRIEGVPQVGQTLQVVWKLEDPDGYGGYSIVWRRNGLDIPDTNRSSYVVQKDDLGCDITVAIQYRDWGGTADGMVSPEPLRISRSALSNGDATPPTVSVAASVSSLKAGQSATVTFSFSEPTADFTLGDVIIQGGALSGFSGSGANYQALFTPATGYVGTATIRVASGVFSDLAGNLNADGNDANNRVSFTVDAASPTVASQSPLASSKRVAVDALLNVRFSEAVKAGPGKATLSTASGTVVEVFDLAGPRARWSGDTLVLDPTAPLQWLTGYQLSLADQAVTDLAGNGVSPGVKMSFRTQAMDEAYAFFAVAFAAAPGLTYMDQICNALNAGATLLQVVEAFTTKTQFTSLYPTTLSHKDFATQLIGRVVGDTATAAVQKQAIADIEAVLGMGISRGRMIFQVFGNLASKPVTDPDWGRTALQFQNQVAVSRHFTEIMGYDSTDLKLLQSVLAPVKATTDVSSEAQIVKIIGSVAGLGAPTLGG